MCDRKKIDWYLKRNLAKQISEKVFQLTFEPKGVGNENPFFLEELANQCVVCGTKDKLSKHHLIPHQYRRTFSSEYKDSNHFDVVCICVDCHEKYEKVAEKFKKQLHKTYKVIQNKQKYNGKPKAINGLLKILKEECEELDPIVIDKILKNLRSKLGTNILIEEVFQMDYLEIPIEKDYIELDKKLVEEYCKEKSLEDFILMWREHFITTMNPQYFSENWLKYYKTFYKKT
jgi:hypothetical protein